jgi:acetyltransferase-like isoleucine patch superfamily enzyme
MKRLIKTVLECLACLLLLPIWLYWFAYRLLGSRSRACQSVGQVMAFWPGWGGVLCRRVVLRGVLARVGKDVVIAFGSVVTKPTAEISDGVYVGSFCLLGDVRIGSETLIADHVCIPSGANQHSIDRLDVPIRQQGGKFQTIQIGQDCWIGSGAVVLADVGDHCVVAAGSVVTKPVSDYMIVGGNPAKVLGDRRGRVKHPQSDGDPTRSN